MLLRLSVQRDSWQLEASRRRENHAVAASGAARQKAKNTQKRWPSQQPHTSFWDPSCSSGLVVSGCPRAGSGSVAMGSGALRRYISAEVETSEGERSSGSDRGLHRIAGGNDSGDREQWGSDRALWCCGVTGRIDQGQGSWESGMRWNVLKCGRTVNGQRSAGARMGDDGAMGRSIKHHDGGESGESPGARRTT